MFYTYIGILALVHLYIDGPKSLMKAAAYGTTITV